MNWKKYFDLQPKKWGHEKPTDFEIAMREVMPFYWFLLAGLVIQYIVTIQNFPRLANPVVLAAFTGLMLLHGWLHWLSPHLTYRQQLALPYILAQGALSLALILISDNASLTYGLFAPLLGEILGMFRFLKRNLLYAALIFVFSVLSYLAVRGADQLWGWALTAIPIAVFVWLYVFLFTRQVQAREAAQNLLGELEDANQKLSAYAAQVEDLTIKTERQRMARELHDTLAQGLAGLILKLEAADLHISSGRAAKAQGIVQQAMQQARMTLADARLAIGDLRAAPQTPADLAAALQVEVARFTETTGIPVDLSLNLPEQISSRCIENILRTVSEGLMNIAKHASATVVALTVAQQEQNLHLELVDNGLGFNPDEAVGKSGHYGLLGIRERARILGGALTIESAPDRGAALKIHFPMEMIDG